ncbi:Oxidoreductase family, NAD-binding Rossmann fold [Novipirellula galeiformis]|uniref:Oxidoreductase family, NAD-binding Rossmann fold n=1 Tax=Novipirellula galeiformis TaxID=2528004 RepID=A0A5C6CNG2_9BACT|nr:Gfo/Idh/MocA family oxidoreductase [Novipirellula galeiformis]TWU25004.1 Oxidoreductase family, NAD-binding Rossmann fold [Novipirellula galeiformis]
MRLGLSIVAVVFSSLTAIAEEPLRIGIIGLDTSHSIAFTKEFNQEKALPEYKNCRVVAAYPWGSRDIPSSTDRIPKYTETVRELGVEIVDSIDALLAKVDCVLLETNDGKPHFEQALQVFKAGKPVFIDKPVGSNLGEVVAIYRAAEKYKVPMFSSSSLRFISNIGAIRDPKFGKVLGCETYSPCSLEPSHVDLYWYGIHGVEALYACMGEGCEKVRHESLPGVELAVGHWEGQRLATFRGIKSGKSGYGGTAFGEKQIQPIGTYAGYKPLLIEIASFFRTGKTPVEASETIELYAFMQAAYESKKQGGEYVTIADVMAAAEKEADELLADK